MWNPYNCLRTIASEAGKLTINQNNFYNHEISNSKILLSNTKASIFFYRYIKKYPPSHNVFQ